jgi:protein-S-isoprenylcysteine O-methyltransferase Ste14
VNRRLPAHVGRVLLGVFIVVERRLRHGDGARTLVAGSDDDGTTRFVGAAFGSAMTLGPLLARSRRGRLPLWLGWSGVGIMAGGLGLRVWSARTLGAHYTRTLRIDEDHQVVDTGPYSRIRHPGYAGTVTMWLGYGLALTSLPATAGMMVPVALAYYRRIGVEEGMLERELGEPYRRYQERTDRLVPGVF